MLTFTSTNGHPLEIQIELRRPTVYLDNCVIRDLAGTETGERIRNHVCTTGTLYLSWAHVIELFGLGHGPTLERIADYLKSFGRHFIIIEADTNKVAQREQDWVPGRQHPVIDEDFIRLIPGFLMEGLNCLSEYSWMGWRMKPVFSRE
jgi:hypothetical protein